MFKALLYIQLSLVILSSIIACSPEAQQEKSNIKPVEISAELNAIYQRSCKNCHEVEATGAPLTGDINRWNEIMNNGMETVLDRAMNGYQGMPPFGQCFECSPKQIEALISYMGNPKK